MCLTFCGVDLLSTNVLFQHCSTFCVPVFHFSNALTAAQFELHEQVWRFDPPSENLVICGGKSSLKICPQQTLLCDYFS